MITVRSAEPADLTLLRRWDEQPHVIASNPNDEWDWEGELRRSPEWREFLIAEHEGRPIGVMQIIDPLREETHYWGDVPAGLRAIDIWIGEADALGRGFGTEMMRQALDRCFDDNDVSAVLVDPLESNTRAHRFYERLGFQFVERRRFGEDDCIVFRLERTMWHGHRESVRSNHRETRVTIRPATPDDVEILFDIRCSVRENHQSRGELAQIGVTPKSVREMIESGDYVSTLVEVDGRPVGFSMAQISERYVFACFVMPDFEGRGAGRAAMAAAEAGLRDAGAEQAWLSTGSDPGLRAVGFYKHLGWREDGYLDDGQLRFVKNLDEDE